MKNIDVAEMAGLLRRTHWTDDKDRERQAVAIVAALKDDEAPAVEEAEAPKGKKHK